MFLRKVFIALWLTAMAAGVGYLFWQQELQYIMPTPVPENYRPAPVQSSLSLPAPLPSPQERPLFIHFFNPDCPCSRFNVKHFNYLQRTYSKNVDFVVVIPEQADPVAAGELLEGDLLIVQDKEGRIADACGVYSSPQAVLIDKSSTLYYRGNYNKARYCTLKASNYAEMALNDLMEGKAPQPFGLFAQKAYGCALAAEPFSDLLLFQ